MTKQIKTIITTVEGNHFEYPFNDGQQPDVWELEIRMRPVPASGKAVHIPMHVELIHVSSALLIKHRILKSKQDTQPVAPAKTVEDLVLEIFELLDVQFKE